MRAHARMMRNDNRVPNRFARFSGETKALQVRDQPISRAAHFAIKRRIRAHARDAKQRLQSLHCSGA